MKSHHIFDCPSSTGASNIGSLVTSVCFCIPNVSGRESGSYPQLRAVATGEANFSLHGQSRITGSPSVPGILEWKLSFGKSWVMPGQVSLEGGMWLDGQQPGPVTGHAFVLNQTLLLGQAFRYYSILLVQYLP